MVTATRHKIGYTAGGLLVGGLLVWWLLGSKGLNPTTSVTPPGVNGSTDIYSILVGGQAPVPTATVLSYSANDNVQVFFTDPGGHITAIMKSNEITTPWKKFYHTTKGANFIISVGVDADHLMHHVAGSESSAITTNSTPYYAGLFQDDNGNTAFLIVGQQGSM